MNKAGKQASVAVGVIIVVAAIGWYAWQKEAPLVPSQTPAVPEGLAGVISKPGPGVVLGKAKLNDSSLYPAFTAIASETSIFTEPKEILAGPGKGDSTTKIYSLSESSQGFNPQTIVVKKGDFVQVSFSAVGGDYDIVVAQPIGAYMEVKKGETRIFGFSADKKGTYPFSCKLLCPDGNEVGGEIVVK